MNMLIIGCGYVGTAVAQRWRQQGLPLTVTTTTPARVLDLSALANRVLVVQGSNAAELESALVDQQVVLLSVGAPNRSAYADTYLTTAKTLVEVLRDNTSVQQIIYTSSYAIYGDHEGNWVTEDTPIRPANANGEILAETERVLFSALGEQRQVCVLRLGGIYGAGRELIKIFGRAAGTTRPGDGTDASNWVHLEDIVGVIDFARVHRLSGVYNLVQDVPITTGILFDRLLTQHNLPPVEWDSTQRSERPYNARVSNQKLRSAGYQFIYPEVQY